MRIDKGITLIALIITIIVMLILAGVALSTLTGEGSIIKNAETAVGEYNNKVVNEQETLNEVIEYIKNDGNVDIEENGISISAIPDTTGLTKTVIVTVVGKADDGVKSFTSTAGDSKTYEDGRTEIVETCEITENGIYTFTIEDINGKTASHGILIENILEGTIQMTPDKEEPTKDNVIVTVIWPSGSEDGAQEIKVGSNSWQSASGNTSEVEVTQNCTVEARVRNSTGDVISASITISNIDKIGPTAPIITGGSTEWSVSRTITVSEKAVETGSGIAYYEYYLSDSEVEPTMSSVATGKVGNTENDISLLFDTDYNGYYVYFRAIDNVTNIGEWSEPQRLFIDINPAIVVGHGFSMTGGGILTVMGQLFSVDNNGNAPIKNIEISVPDLDIEPGYHETILFPNATKTYIVICNVTKENGLTTTEESIVSITRGSGGAGGASSRP